MPHCEYCADETTVYEYEHTPNIPFAEPEILTLCEPCAELIEDDGEILQRTTRITTKESQPCPAS